jgi:hypothetical protein
MLSAMEMVEKVTVVAVPVEEVVVVEKPILLVLIPKLNVNLLRNIKP